MSEKREISIFDTRMLSAEYARNVWIVNAETGTTPSDVLEPIYWAHVASRLSPYDRIEVRAEEGDWVMELIVIACERNWARVHVLHKHELASPNAVPAAENHQVMWKGPQKKFCVIRVADMQAVQEGFADKRDAYAWMVNHEVKV